MKLNSLRNETLPIFLLSSASLLLISFIISGCGSQSISDLKKHKESYSKVGTETNLDISKSTDAQSRTNPNPANHKQKKGASKPNPKAKLSLSGFSQEKTDSTTVDSTIVIKGTINGYQKFKKGLKINLSGSAIDRRMVSAPNIHGTFLKELGEGFQLFQNVEELVFARKGVNSLESNFSVSKLQGYPLELTLSMKALKPGKGTIIIKVEGTGKKKEVSTASVVLFIEGEGFNGQPGDSTSSNWDKNYEQFQKRHNQEFLNETMRKIHKQSQ